MNAYKANLVNSVILIGLGIWGYLDVNSSSENIQYTPLIPVGFGLILLACSTGIKKQNKVIAHIAVTLTLVILIALSGMRLPKSIDKGGLGLIRVVMMIFSSSLSMLFFVKSFIAARKNKQQ